ncbi:MAG: SMI1/KNR4 family protein [Polyangiaceae bacterium]
MRTAAEVRDLLERLRIRTTGRLPADDWTLNPPLRLSTIVTFEAAYRVRLPEEYRDFLLHIGNGGAGPEGGLCRSEDYERRGRTDLERLHVEFDADAAEQDWDPEEEVDGDVMDDCLPLVDTAEGIYWLVVSGPYAGELWWDTRSDDSLPPEPVVDDEGEVTFRAWYDAWLDECEARWLK